MRKAVHFNKYLDAQGPLTRHDQEMFDLVARQANYPSSVVRDTHGLLVSYPFKGCAAECLVDRSTRYWLTRSRLANLTETKAVRDELLAQDKFRQKPYAPDAGVTHYEEAVRNKNVATLLRLRPASDLTF